MFATPSQQEPLNGRCLCGAVRFQVGGPILSAGYCHCTHCQKRTGTGSSANCRVRRDDLKITSGIEHLRSYEPPTGAPKLFCSICGSALFSGDFDAHEEVAVRLGAFDEDPGVRPQYRQFVDSASPWEPIPQDGLERHPRSRTNPS